MNLSTQQVWIPKGGGKRSNSDDIEVDAVQSKGFGKKGSDKKGTGKKGEDTDCPDQHGTLNRGPRSGNALAALWVDTRAHSVPLDIRMPPVCPLISSSRRSQVGRSGRRPELRRTLLGGGRRGSNRNRIHIPACCLTNMAHVLAKRAMWIKSAEARWLRRMTQVRAPTVRSASLITTDAARAVSAGRGVARLPRGMGGVVWIRPRSVEPLSPPPGVLRQCDCALPGPQEVESGAGVDATHEAIVVIITTKP